MRDPDPPPVTVRMPQVTLRGAPVADPSSALPPPERSVAPVLVLLALAALAVVVGAQPSSSPPPPPAAPPVRQGLHAELELSVAGVSSRGGILVVPVVLHNRGGLLRLRSTDVHAEPVLSYNATTAPAAVGPGDSRRFLVLVEPDCSSLAPATGLVFRAELVVVVADRTGATQTLELDLARDPWVVSAVLGLCQRG